MVQFVTWLSFDPIISKSIFRNIHFTYKNQWASISSIILFLNSVITIYIGTTYVHAGYGVKD